MFANHAHLMPDWMNPAGTLAELLRLMEKCKLEGVVCFAPFSYQVTRRFFNPNKWLAKTIRGENNLVGFGTLNPNKPPEPQVKMIVDLGFPGIKLHPAAQQFDMLGQWAMKTYEQMEKHDLIADFHVAVHWHRLADYNPLHLDEIAFHFPNLKMVFEHVGGWHFFRQVLAVIANNQGRGNHLYAGIATVLDRENVPHWYLGPEGLEECRWQIGDDRLIYGLDFPYNNVERVKKDLEIIERLKWPTSAIDGLLGGNLEALLRLDVDKPPKKPHSSPEALKKG